MEKYHEIEGARLAAESHREAIRKLEQINQFLSVRKTIRVQELQHKLEIKIF